MVNLLSTSQKDLDSITTRISVDNAGAKTNTRWADDIPVSLDPDLTISRRPNSILIIR